MDINFCTGFEKVAVSFQWIGKNIGKGLKSRAMRGGKAGTLEQYGRIEKLIDKKIKRLGYSTKRPVAPRKGSSKKVKEKARAQAESFGKGNKFRKQVNNEAFGPTWDNFGDKTQRNLLLSAENPNLLKMQDKAKGPLQ